VGIGFVFLADSMAWFLDPKVGDILCLGFLEGFFKGIQ